VIYNKKVQSCFHILSISAALQFWLLKPSGTLSSVCLHMALSAWWCMKEAAWRVWLFLGAPSCLKSLRLRICRVCVCVCSLISAICKWVGSSPEGSQTLLRKIKTEDFTSVCMSRLMLLISIFVCEMIVSSGLEILRHLRQSKSLRIWRIHSKPHCFPFVRSVFSVFMIFFFI